ncbi:MAG: [acyl-carrier-protein] S-malonyltransferase [Rhodospirillaceae bacterium]|nr:MAG: [acyl-carrier-protein] S-malonyltransferase [Rhodospirillaceae bacterium]
MSWAYVFPGQGSQAVGMGKELAAAFPEAREIFGEVDHALKQNLSRLMFEGPDDELTLTENAQPALMAVSMAVVAVLQKQGNISIRNTARYVAGHSLGEYSALAAAGSLTLSDAARLLKTRGQAMQKAVPVGEGAMAALLGLDLDQAQEVAGEAATNGEVCAAANDNAPGQVVVSGHRAAIERAIGLAKAKGAKRAIMLPVSAPFHCALMKPAADVMAEALAVTKILSPAVPVIANVTASTVVDPDEIRRLLVEQVTALVRWRESVHLMKEAGVDTLIELGAGKVLSGLAKRIDGDLTGISLQTPQDIEAFAKRT